MATYQMGQPACILCWCHDRATVEATTFDGIAWYCDGHYEEVLERVIRNRRRPSWIHRFWPWIGRGSR